MFASQNSLP